MPDYRETLRKIRTFPSLIKFLRDELDWPISSDDFEELTFEYTPEELGIDTATAAKIQEIKRLRPLTASQPWGIFFVKFEPKRLPVVALRRILSRVVVKQRASANSAERAAWQTDDLLFVSNYGEGQERRISFAHFTQDGQTNDLPVLKVLGWDNLDTPLHLDDVADVLSERLAWPEDEDDAESWRETWRSAFTVRHREVITTSKALAVRLAELARSIRDRIKSALAIETKTGPLTKLMKAFQEALVHDLDPDGFADMYAQTIAYGLLSARIADPERKTADDLAAHMRTNPFLKELMETFLHVGGRRGRAGGPGIDFDELGVSEVVELLDDANMEAVVRDFGDRNPQEDPVIHFYEDFLAAYDKKQKVQRGVFYTPRPVVSYIVRSVDELLRTEFGLEDGLADTTNWGEMAKRHEGLEIPEGVSRDQVFVQILDPATGTGTFLVEVIDVIHKKMVGKWKAQGHGEEKIHALWNDYVPNDLLQRLHGYELLMAPYAIAHLKVGLKLYETGYRFGSGERARIYLTNALEPASDKQLRLDFLPALAHEAQAVNEIKRKHCFTVVIGNPPYSGLSANMSPQAQRLVDAYKIVDGEPLGERKLWLQDDYVKFIRLAQSTLEQGHIGVVGFITNHGYLDNPTFRGMRQSLMGTLPRIRVIDLHGNANKREQPPDGVEDKNVFDIRQGVAILLATRSGATPWISHSELWGSRSEKYAWMMSTSESSVNAARVVAAPPFYLFVPRDSDIGVEYSAGWSVSDIFPTHGVGVVTARDALTIDISEADLWNRVCRFVNLPAEDARTEYRLGRDVQSWRVEWAQEDIRRSGPDRKLIKSISYRPFDHRYIYYTGASSGFVCRPVRQVMQHMLFEPNLALVTTRAVEIGRGFEHAFCVRSLIQHHSVSLKEVNYLLPLWVRSDSSAVDGTLFFQEADRRLNLAPRFLQELAESLALDQTAPTSMPAGIEPEAVFYYIYALLHCPIYRSRYAEFLKTDYPRIPVPGSRELLRNLGRLGGELVAMHLMESPKVNHFITTYTGPKNPEVGRVGWSDGTVWLDAGKTNAREGHRATNPGNIGFKGVPEEVWDFHIGGYQVCHKWLKDRKGRRLSKDDLAHYQRIVVALNETIRLMREIDEVIDQHGGWPDAFQTEGSQVSAAGTS